MKKITMGILAHVDAGKTTLTESLLLNTGMIRAAGRVDDGNAFLDTEELEKKRGVTILSKQAIIDMDKSADHNKAGDDVRITIIDTPGHIDFIGETERALSVLDAAVLLISGPDGVTATTRRLLSMLDTYKVPFFVFVNKMDMCDRSREEIVNELCDNGSGFVDFSNAADIYDSEKAEEIASLSEDTIERFLESGTIDSEDIMKLIYSRKLHPVLFGSALKNIGINDFLDTFTAYIPDIKYRDAFSAKVYKLGFEDGHKISFAKITGGRISVRETIGGESDEKISQIRLYNGGKYESVSTAEAGDVVGLLEIDSSFIGMGLGIEPDDRSSLCQPVMRYSIVLPIDVAPRVFIPKFKELVMENPLLYMDISEDDTITVSIMGEFQLDILKSQIMERCGVMVSFAPAGIILKETITEPVIGYGHFEPLRHYAEVQILMEPLPRGSGIEVASALSVNDLGINWQKTILSTISNDLPSGVLTGSPLTDIRFTLIAGKAHLKHTDSQDFREAVRRAIRQGLMKTESILLEPEFAVNIQLPYDYVGRAMNDIIQMGGKCVVEKQRSNNGENYTYLSGDAPARCLADYQMKLTEYTSGRGSMDMRLIGYRNLPDDIAEEMIADIGYDPDNDKNNLSGSVFIEHGAGYFVPWYECQQLMHLPDKEAEYFETDAESEEERLDRLALAAKREAEKRSGSYKSVEEKYEAIGTDDIDEIIRNATHANAGAENRRTKRVYLSKQSHYSSGNESGKNRSQAVRKAATKDKYLLVDGYNIIHAWKNLKDLLSDDAGYGDSKSLDLESARFKLLEILSEYKALKDIEIIVVFDAYKVKGHITEKMDYLGVHIVYTKEAETADQYIARFTLKNAKTLDITVATSDGMIQLIIRSEDTKLMTAGDLERDVVQCRKNALESLK